MYAETLDAMTPESEKLEGTAQQAVLTDLDSQLPEALQSKYRYIRELGRGAQGRVFLAERQSDGIRVAIKQLNIESVKNWKAYDLFKREAAVLEGLQIDGIARFYEAVEYLEGENPYACIVQEYIPGRTLQDLLRQGHRFDVHSVYNIALQVLTILQNLHGHVPPIIHRDIKPSNLLLVPLNNNQYKVWLIDFGAVANPQIQGGGSTVAGTYGYMAPEQLMGNPGPACDIYALAAVLVYMMSGVSPADMPVKDFHLIFEPEMQSAHPSVVKVLRQMLEPKIEDRLTDIEQLKTTFTQFIHDEFLLKDISTLAEWSSLQLNNKLRDIQEYGEAGNIELWQRLPEQTPRDIPECCESELSNLQQLELNDIIVSSNDDVMFTSLFGKIIGNTLVYTIAPLVLPVIILYSIGDGPGLAVGLILELVLIYLFIQLPLVMLKIYIVMIGICILVVVADKLSDKSNYKKAIKNWLKGLRKKVDTRSSTNGTLGDDEDLQKNLQKWKKSVFKEGRKTIARITKIEYVPIERNMFKFNNEYSEFGLMLLKPSQPQFVPKPEKEIEQKPKPEIKPIPESEKSLAVNQQTTQSPNTWSGFAKKELENGPVFKKDFSLGNANSYSIKAYSHERKPKLTQPQNTKPEIKPIPDSKTSLAINQQTTQPQNTLPDFAKKELESEPGLKTDITNDDDHAQIKNVTEGRGRLQMPEDSEKEKDHLFMAVYYGAPTFKISYAFNPPDDLREEDIVHDCYIHYDPGEHLKVGDALPILYLIERKSRGLRVYPDDDGMFRQAREDISSELIISMPFPFPLADPIDERDILCTSYGY